MRRIPDLNPTNKSSPADGAVKSVQEVLFETWRSHAFFTTTSPEGPRGLDTVAADKIHRGHAIR